MRNLGWYFGGTGASLSFLYKVDLNSAFELALATMICIYCGTEFDALRAACPACGMATTPETKTLPVGTDLHAGKYAVGRVLGEGGFGITYKGAHRALRRPVAIKELFPEGAVRRGTRVTVSAMQREDFQRERDRALQEAQAMAGFQSRHIVDVSDMFPENDTTYIVMEYLEGQTLEARIQAQGALPWEEIQGLALNLCEALEEVHSRQLLHRDLKPANIMLATDGRTVLLDFGSARPFRTGQTMQHTRTLTEDYAAPEQYSQQARFGPCTDIFGLGATLYHALTGSLPSGALERLQGFAPATVTFPPGLPQPVCTALRQALELRVEDRPQTIEAFRSALLGARADAPLASGAGPRAAADRDAAADLVRQGNAQLTQGQYQAAIADCDRALQLDPDSADAYHNRGYAKASLDQHAAAIADYDQALRLNPDDAMAYNNRGVAKANLEQYAAAIVDYDQALQRNPNDASAYHNRGVAKANLKQYAAAIADYDQALQRNPNDAMAYYNRGNAKAELEQHAAAITDYDRALQLNPDDASAYNNRGNAKRNLGQHAAAIADYDQALRRDPDHAPAYWGRGWSKAELEQHAAAITDYDRALQLNPDDASAYNNRGNAKFNLKQYAAAIADYDQALRLNPDDALHYHNRGNAKFNLKQYAAAIADYDQALRRDLDDAAAVYRNRGDCKTHLSQYTEAIADYDRALRLNPNHAGAYRSRGDAKAELGQYAEAIVDYDQALRLEPDFTAARYNRMQAIRMKDLEQADPPGTI